MLSPKADDRRRGSVVARIPERLLSTTNLQSLVQVVDVKLRGAKTIFRSQPILGTATPCLLVRFRLRKRRSAHADFCKNAVNLKLLPECQRPASKVRCGGISLVQTGLASSDISTTHNYDRQFSTPRGR